MRGYCTRQSNRLPEQIVKGYPVRSSFPSKFDAPIDMTARFCSARMPALIAFLMEGSSMPFMTIS